MGNIFTSEVLITIIGFITTGIGYLVGHRKQKLENNLTAEQLHQTALNNVLEMYSNLSKQVEELGNQNIELRSQINKLRGELAEANDKLIELQQENKHLKDQLADCLGH